MKLTLHEAMVIVLLSCGDRAGTFEFISEQIELRDLFRKKSGDFASSSQIKLRALRYPKWFEINAPNMVKIKSLADPKSKIQPSPYYILFYKTVDEYANKRAPYREEHLKYATAAHEKGLLYMAGALAEPADTAILIFKGDSPKGAEDFARNDPYVRKGLIAEWHVRPWTVVIGG